MAELEGDELDGSWCASRGLQGDARAGSCRTMTPSWPSPRSPQCPSAHAITSADAEHLVNDDPDKSQVGSRLEASGCSAELQCQWRGGRAGGADAAIPALRPWPLGCSCCATLQHKSCLPKWRPVMIRPAVGAASLPKSGRYAGARVFGYLQAGCE